MTKSTQSRLSRKFQQLKWSGEAYREQRRIVSCLMAARDTGRPVRIVASVAEMTEADAAHAVEVCESLLRNVDGDLDALGGRLQRVYDAYVEQQARDEAGA